MYTCAAPSSKHAHDPRVRQRRPIEPRSRRCAPSPLVGGLIIVQAGYNAAHEQTQQTGGHVYMFEGWGVKFRAAPDEGRSSVNTG